MTMIDEWTKLLNLSEWEEETPETASGKLKSSNTIKRLRKYLRDVTTAVYVMQSTVDRTRFRAGAFGYRKTTALVRLESVNSDQKWKKDPEKYAPFEYIFLAPLPDDLGHKLEEAETNYLHADITHFLGIRTPGKNPFQLDPKMRHPEKAIQDVATKATKDFLNNRYIGSSSNVDLALRQFFSLSRKFHQDPVSYNSIQEFIDSEATRASSVAEINSGFNGRLIKELLLYLASGKLTFSGLSPIIEPWRP